MSKNKQPTSSPAREQKRAEFSSPTQSRNNRKKLLLGLAAAAIATGGYFVGGNLNGQATQAKPISAATGPASVKIPIVDLDGGKAKFFEYKTPDNRSIRFFAMKSSDGVYRAALDACDVCYEAKKGYVQDGDDMICRKCGRHFHSAKINEVTGGCNPVGLKRTVADGQLIIAASNLEAGKSFF